MYYIAQLLKMNFKCVWDDMVVVIWTKIVIVRYLWGRDKELDAW